MNSVSFSGQWPHARGRSRGRGAAAFTLVEILVSMAVLSVLLLVSAGVIGQVQDTWTRSNARVSQFREARTAFDILTRNLSQATLNTYIDYDTNYLSQAAPAAAATAPTQYLRKSDLQFICGPAANLVRGGGGGGEQYLPGDAVFFQAPLGIAQQPGLVGLDRLLCGRGYYVQFSSDAFFIPQADFLPPGNLRYRYRLMEFCPPAEKNLVYANREANPNDESWFAAAGAPMDNEENALNLSLNRPVADNIVSLIISPREEDGVSSINDSVSFNSRDLNATADLPQGYQHLMPPMLKIVLVAIDERSAERLSSYNNNTEPPQDLAAIVTDFQDDVGTEASDVKLNAAMQTLRDSFVKKNINFRVFSTTVQIRGAKWSK